MNLDDFSGRGLLRRWYLLDGQARCPFDAVEPARLSQAQRDAILANNADVRDKLAAVEAYEAAQRLLAGDKPDEGVWIEDGEGGRALIPNPAHTAWLAAEQAVENVSDETLALARLRGGIYPLDEKDQPIVPEPDDPGPDPLADLPPYEPVPEEISDRQFAQELAIRGIITENEALAWAGAGTLPAAMMAAINKLPADQRFAAKMSLASATTYRRSHPLANMLGALLGYDAAEVDDLWRAAAKH